jgi:hypothetical protein
VLFIHTSPINYLATEKSVFTNLQFRKKRDIEKGDLALYTCKQSIMAPSVSPEQSAMSAFVPHYGVLEVKTIPDNADGQ